MRMACHVGGLPAGLMHSVRSAQDTDGFPESLELVPANRVRKRNLVDAVAADSIGSALSVAKVIPISGPTTSCGV